MEAERQKERVKREKREKREKTEKKEEEERQEKKATLLSALRVFRAGTRLTVYRGFGRGCFVVCGPFLCGHFLCGPFRCGFRPRCFLVVSCVAPFCFLWAS